MGPFLLLSAHLTPQNIGSWEKCETYVHSLIATKDDVTGMDSENLLQTHVCFVCFSKCTSLD